ncbi:hypothetical protein [Salinibacter altiplanensis]|uniref:hypothetical protein n=1 Tax=Salinibacter altiplanensis TaxID=1803181 RepID=UPI001E53F5D9|nr:hypothetical protein [Salinibacter altiplanensis]
MIRPWHAGANRHRCVRPRAPRFFDTTLQESVTVRFLRMPHAADVEGATNYV